MPEQFVVPKPSDKPSLADANVVLSVVREFEAEVMRISAGFNAGRPGFEDAKSLVLEACKKYGDIFCGLDPAYEPAPWGRMNKAWMHYMVMESSDDEAKALSARPMDQAEPGKAYFLMLAKMVMRQSQRLAAGTPEPEVMGKLDEITNNFCSIFLGVN